ncbi:hypothetical protein CFN78_21075 [Amycolatopsis antarctica]|uniref:DUF11 domain-containing protein n=1 Tax=Amycolatopsis antarctica TaxID=1854586 RepID=A0A263D0X3_9PSEU|nr:hypothetical protein [Amycolatopsis antarctica]OZM71287.1 hypothetical protein CFN78_21075 [Amycolatopsis antarctica]
MTIRGQRVLGAGAGVLLTLGLGALPARAAEPVPDVALDATPTHAEFWAGRSGATLRLDYYNPGEVAKTGDTVSATVPAGLTVEPRPSPGWECHISDFPAVVCNTAGTLEPGAVGPSIELWVTADAPVSAEFEFTLQGFYRDPAEPRENNHPRVTVQAT